ncbi:MAG: sugar ABC transporter ATP-binding protein [Vicinamibacterales bacterium]
MRTSAVSFRDLRKSFGAVRALGGVSFDVAAGEAHALVGENGAGKSTLLKILSGSLRPDSGELCLDGRPIALARPRDALAHGIGIVHQEMLAFPDLSVSANIFAGRELTRRGLLREREMGERTRSLLDRLHVPVSPHDLAGSLSAAYRQLVQVARALAFDCRILALDEPTTSLTDAEVDHLFRVLADLKSKGTTLIYVSHRLPEVFALCDRITVLRDGGHAGTFDRAGTRPDAIVRAMVGRDLPPRVAAGDGGDSGPRASDEPRFTIDRLTRRPYFEDVSLSIRPGEIVCLFGLVGSGRSELLETLFALHAPHAGSVRIDGRECRFAAPRDAARAGLALVPEDRQQQGLFVNLDLRHNLVLPRETARASLVVRRRAEQADAREMIRAWNIKTPGCEAFPDSLSGGNQQKVVVARWLAMAPRMLLMDEPTKGVDVGAKFEIHEIIRRQAAEGTACLIASSDLPEVLELAHRVVVMREGRIQGEVAGERADEESVMRLATAEPGAAA